jgi:hypothetical protein
MSCRVYLQSIFRVAETLNGKGSVNRGNYQGKANKLSQKGKAEKLIQEYLSSKDDNVKCEDGSTQEKEP